ncbi:MAG: hypothetical protein JNK90_10830, partial [Planctomycetaceae bacterium]|nr:hypothetical protein [Planctomycetaceae bacterium]
MTPLRKSNLHHHWVYSNRNRRVVKNNFYTGYMLGWLGLLLATPTFAQQPTPTEGPLNFVRDIQPILANHCWSCHGPDEKTRAADLRLDLMQVAIDAKAIVPTKPEESSVIARIHSTNEEEVMPPPATKKPLTDPQKKMLERWIKEGANFEGHWAFQPIQRTTRSPANPQLGKSSIIDAI